MFYLVPQPNHIKVSGRFRELPYHTLKKWSDAELQKIYEGYGEMDAFSIIRLLKNGENVCNISINLIHNSFARRDWVLPGEDLYKGNGRVKHQYHSIQQGPFQNIQIHNYQATDKHDVSTNHDYELGGKNHFEVHVYRNVGMFRKNEKRLKVYKIEDIKTTGIEEINSGLVNESAKELVVVEFIKAIKGDVLKPDLLSSIETHNFPTQLMSSIYCSHINQTQGKSPIVKFSIDE